MTWRRGKETCSKDERKTVKPKRRRKKNIRRKTGRRKGKRNRGKQWRRDERKTGMEECR